MTKKLYQLDSYQTKFKAVLLEKKLENNKIYLILDQTYFYPEAGGQLCDKGSIEGIPVIDVQEKNGKILHFLKEDIHCKPNSVVRGEINWEIRFDHMQQHTGQHLFSAALLQLWQQDTLSFHMSEEVSTIDINSIKIDEVKLRYLEEKMNRIIYANKTIFSYHLEDQKENIDSADISIRKKVYLQEKMRIIEIEDYDKNACGGTHCKTTGEIGVIKIINWENRKEKIRLYFLCGKRAFQDYQKKHQITKQLANFFTTGVDQLEEKILHISQEQKKLTKKCRTQEKKLLSLGADALVAEHCKKIDDLHLISAIYPEMSLDNIRQLVSILLNKSDNKYLIAIGAKQPEPIVCLACFQDYPIHMGELVKNILLTIDGKGGGSNYLGIGKLKRDSDISSFIQKASSEFAKV